MNLALGMLKFIICSLIGAAAGFGAVWCVGLLPQPLPTLAGMIVAFAVAGLAFVTWEKIAEGWSGNDKRPN